MRLTLILFFLLHISFLGFTQKQLLILKKEKVILRLNPGDEFVYQLKKEKRVISSYVNNIFDTAVMVHNTIVPFYKIERIYFKQSNHLNVLGSFLVTAGVGYFIIDQVNESIVHGNGLNIDSHVLQASITLTAIGLPLMLLHKKSQRIKGKYRLLMVESESPFYKAPLLKPFP